VSGSLNCGPTIICPLRGLSLKLSAILQATVDDVSGLFPKPLRLLFYDIETAPMLAFVWQQKADWIPHNQIVTEKFMLAWSAKFSDTDKVHSAVLNGAEAKAQDDSRIVKSLAELVKQADYIVAHNGDRFDLPTMNGRLLLNQLDPLGDVQTIDTLKIARQSFNLTSNRLDYLAKRLDVVDGTGKLPVTFDLWRRCFYGEAEALKQMRTYNEHDSVLLEHVFHALRPYAKRLPRMVDAAEWRQEICPYCGSVERTKERRDYRTGVNNYPRFRCGECRRTYRGWQAIGSRKAGSVGL